MLMFLKVIFEVNNDFISLIGLETYRDQSYVA